MEEKKEIGLMPCKYHYFNIMNLALKKENINNLNLYHELNELPDKCKTTLYFKNELNNNITKEIANALNISETSKYKLLTILSIVIDKEKDSIIKNCKNELSWFERMERIYYNNTPFKNLFSNCKSC